MRILAVLIVLTSFMSCGKKSSTINEAPPEGIQGNWTSGCVSGTVYKMVITSSLFTLTQKNFDTVSCDVGTQYRFYENDSTYNYDENAETVHLVDLRGYATFWNPTFIALLNDGNDDTDICGSKDWQVGVRKDVTDVTPCDSGNLISGNVTQYPLAISDPDSLILAGALTFTRE